MLKKFTESRASSFITGCALAALFIYTERCCRSNFLFSFSYRAQTITTIMTVACSWFTIAFFAWYVFKNRKDMDFGIILPFTLVFLGYLISSALSPEKVSYAHLLDIFIYSWPAIFLATVFLPDRDDALFYTRTALIVYTVLAALNLLFIAFPQLYPLMSEWREEYFLGYHTYLGWALTMGVMFALLYREYRGRNTLTYFYLVIYFVNLVTVYCGGAKVGGIIVAAWLVIPFLRRIFEKWSLNIFVAVSAAVFAALVWGLSAITKIGIVRVFIEDVLKRDVTLSGRLYIWQIAVEKVFQRPLLGFGIGTTQSFVFEPSKWNNAWVHAHNLFLQTWHDGGLLTLFAAFLMLAYTSYRLRSASEKKIAGLMKMIIFSFLIMLQNDQDVYFAWYMVALLCQSAIISCRSTKRLIRRLP